MYPAATSLIPVQVALAKYLVESGWPAIFNLYPYWYLGSTPFRFLTGPVMPFWLALWHGLLPGFNYFQMYWISLAFGFGFGAVGLYFLALRLGGHRRVAVLASVLYLFGPFLPILLPFGDGLTVIAFSFLPLVYLTFLNFLEQKNFRYGFAGLLLMSFVLLLDASIMPTLLLGLLIVLAATRGLDAFGPGLKQGAALFLGAVGLATLWYTPAFWLKLLGAPSFGGQSLAAVILWLTKIIPLLLALVLALFSGQLVNGKDRLRQFSFYWLFVFLTLSLMRFLSDPHFWQDWASYGLELQLGLALVLAQVLNQNRRLSWFNLPFFFVFIYSFIFLFLFNRFFLGSLQTDIAQTPNFRLAAEIEKRMQPGEKVFLSGTDVFWLNASFNLPQLRGGVDQASVDPSWRSAAWEIREGTDPGKTEGWLRKLGLSYVVVHTSDSTEYYHDFKDPEKFDRVKGLEKVFEREGDILYRLTPESF